MATPGGKSESSQHQWTLLDRISTKVCTCPLQERGADGAGEKARPQLQAPENHTAFADHTKLLMIPSLSFTVIPTVTTLPAPENCPSNCLLCQHFFSGHVTCAVSWELSQAADRSLGSTACVLSLEKSFQSGLCVSAVPGRTQHLMVLRQTLVNASEQTQLSQLSEGRMFTSFEGSGQPGPLESGCEGLPVP